MVAHLKKSYNQPRQCIKNRHHFANKGPYSQSCGFYSSHVQMWELEHEKAWKLKNWCFWAVVLKKTLESPMDCKEIKPVNPEGNQSRLFIGRTDDEAAVPILWPPHVKSWLIGKDSDAGGDWGQEAECRRIDAFKLWCWRRLLRVPWTARRSNQSI